MIPTSCNGLLSALAAVCCSVNVPNGNDKNSQHNGHVECSSPPWQRDWLSVNRRHVIEVNIELVAHTPLKLALQPTPVYSCQATTPTPTTSTLRSHPYVFDCVGRHVVAGMHYVPRQPTTPTSVECVAHKG